jgi:hypothetical protein
MQAPQAILLLLLISAASITNPPKPICHTVTCKNCSNVFTERDIKGKCNQRDCHLELTHKWQNDKWTELDVKI